MKFIDVYREPMAPAFLYSLLKERTPEQSISHKRMPSIDEHISFIISEPYPQWYLVEVDDELIGSVYLTDNREIGVFILERLKGIGLGKMIVEKMCEDNPGRILANINPDNMVSRKMFEGMGAKLIQVTYELG
jgi:RimJ/RimL family protein N-acetyltransferase